MIRYLPMSGLLVMAAVQAQAQDAGTCTPNQGHPFLRPIMSTHLLPPYPKLGVDMELEGVTLVRVDIGVDGVPTSTTLARTSGATRLDKAALEYIRAVWKWQPPLDLNCAPTRVATMVSVAWHLLDRPKAEELSFSELPVALSDFPRGAADRKEQGLVTLEATVLRNGSIAKIEVKDSSGYPNLDDRALEIAKARFRPKAADIGGGPGPTKLGILITWTLPVPSKR